MHKVKWNKNNNTSSCIPPEMYAVGDFLGSAGNC